MSLWDKCPVNVAGGRPVSVGQLSIAGFRAFAESVFGDMVDPGEFSVIEYRKCERFWCDEIIMNVESCCNFVCKESHMGIVCELLYEMQAMFIEVMLEFHRSGEVT
ncbi:24811_t:CDS:2 [Gigaspora rosea]|nr:24811_t:CDS:2 [Gigaspora rosea]